MGFIKTDLKVKSINPTIGYFPARTQPKEGAFDWEIAKGVVVRNLYNKIISKKVDIKANDDINPYGAFRDLCKEEFNKVLDEPEMWPYIERMYFSSDAFYNIAPECLLFKILKKQSPSKNPLADMFSSLMQGYYNEKPERIKRNFLEAKLVDVLRSEDVLHDFEGNRFLRGDKEEPYLPFLSELFCEDIKFLSNYPKYLMQNLEEFLRLYGYLYTSQLVLNLDGLTEVPFVRPVYFILENEVASVERSDLFKKGHQNVSKKLKLIFPYLTMSESIQDIAEQGKRIPLWQVLPEISSNDVESLKIYAAEFAEQRGLLFDFDLSMEQPLYWIRALLTLSVRQFGQGQSRHSANEKFIKSAEMELCATFVRSRGRAGKILVMNQDYLSLLTNLCIGQRDRLRFHELIGEFSRRGVNFDKQTQQVLIKFYDRVGNVERMSDSGDAVYVRKTV